jgi:hypothetical protein
MAVLFGFSATFMKGVSVGTENSKSKAHNFIVLLIRVYSVIIYFTKYKFAVTNFP